MGRPSGRPFFAVKEDRDMKTKSVIWCCTSVLLLVLVALDARAQDAGPKSLESLIGKFDGTIQVDKINPVEHRYQTEVVSVNSSARTLSLTAYCVDCAIKHWKRSDCKITEKHDAINFTCKGQVRNEEYTFDGESLRATGFGNKYPYSIRVTKVSEAQHSL
jgi:hypothetical protein